MTVEISADTHRLLRQLAMIGNTTVDTLSEQVLRAFSDEVMISGSRKLETEIRAMWSKSTE